MGHALGPRSSRAGTFLMGSPAWGAPPWGPSGPSQETAWMLHTQCPQLRPSLPPGQGTWRPRRSGGHGGLAPGHREPAHCTAGCAPGEGTRAGLAERPPRARSLPAGPTAGRRPRTPRGEPRSPGRPASRFRGHPAARAPVHARCRRKPVINRPARLGGACDDTGKCLCVMRRVPPPPPRGSVTSRGQSWHL